MIDSVILALSERVPVNFGINKSKDGNTIIKHFRISYADGSLNLEVTQTINGFANRVSLTFKLTEDERVGLLVLFKAAKVKIFGW